MTTLNADMLIADPIGCYPSATVACFDATRGELPRRTFDDERNLRFLEQLGRYGAPAVLIAASTGHGHVRTVDELLHWFQVADNADLGRTVRMALLRPEDGLAANVGLLEALTRLDYPVVFVRPGRDLPASATDADVAANLRPIVEAAAARGFAVGVYSIPDVSGVRLTADAAAMLVHGPGGERIVAAKVTEVDYEASTLRFLEHPDLRHLKIVQGWDTHLAQALRDGPRHDARGRQRCGVTSGPMSFALFQYLHLLSAAERGEWDEVAAAQQAVTLLFQAMQDDPRKFADLQRAKYIMGLGQPLTGEVTQSQVARVMEALRTVPRVADRRRLARSLDLLGDGPLHAELATVAAADEDTTVGELRRHVARFVADRDWERFHAPKNLAMSLAIEAAELMEHFQWITTEASRNVADEAEKRQAIGAELADVLCYALALANELKIDVATALADKLVQNAAKYPAAEFRGRYGQEDAGT